MRRRKFLADVASAVALGPLSSVAQQTQQTHGVGVLVGLAPSEDTPIAQAFIKPFRESMRSAGWIERAISKSTIASAVLSPIYPERKRPQPSGSTQARCHLFSRIIRNTRRSPIDGEHPPSFLPN
jgi:hypothetical protein